MVESETFVSHRRRHGGRKTPRKLFTAKGLFDGGHERNNGASDEYVQGAGETKDEHIVPPGKSTKGDTKASLPSFCPPNAKPKSHLAEKTHKWKYKSLPSNFHIDDSTRDDADSSSLEISEGNGLEEVLQMGCMDNLFFSAPIGRKDTKGKQRTNSRTKAHLPLPRIKINHQLCHVGKAAYMGGTRLKSSLTNSFDCKLPYQGGSYGQLMGDHSHSSSEGCVSIGDVGSRTDFMGPDRPEFRPPKIEETKHESRHKPAVDLLPLDYSSMSFEAPVSQIFIGEEPCFSDDLVPVDDLPPPGVECNLTKYHPKPSTGRLHYAFGRPMLSMDSEESDVSEKGITHKDPNQSARRQPSLMKTECKSPVFQNQKDFKNENHWSSFDEAGPSFDNQEIKKTGTAQNINSPNAIRSSAASHDMTLLPEFANTSTSNSSASSAATDEAISDEKALKQKAHAPSSEVFPEEKRGTSPGLHEPPNLEPLIHEANENAAPPNIGESGSTMNAISEEDENSFDPVQDENDSPVRTFSLLGLKHSGVESRMSDPCRPSSPRRTLASMGSSSFRSSSPHPPSHGSSAKAEVRRKPFDLMVGTNFPMSPNTALDDEEFFSPRATTPKKRNSSRGGHGHRFVFHDSFDEAEEFFDSAMA